MLNLTPKDKYITHKTRQNNITTNSRYRGENTTIHRVPYPELDDIPSGLRGFAKNLKGMVDSSTYLDLLRDLAVEHYSNMYSADKADWIAEITDEQIGSAGRRRKTAYAGLLQEARSGLSLGQYNPDKISYKVYDRMQRDAQINLGLSLIKKPIEHVNISAESTSDSVKALVQWTFDKIYVRLVRDLLMAVDFGHSYLEKSWQRIPNLVLKKKKESINETIEEVVYDQEALLLMPYSIHPESYTVIVDKHGELHSIKQTGRGKDAVIKRSKLITYINNMQYGNWFGISRLKPAYSWWYWGEIVLQFMMKYLERKSSPPIIVRAPIGVSTDSAGQPVNNFALALKLGNSLISNAVGVLPNVLDPKTGKPLWDAEYLMDDQRIFMFIEVLKYLDIMKMRALQVPDTVAIQSSKGSYGQSDAHSDIHLMLEESVIREIESVLNNQVVPYIIKYNFAPEDRASCKIKIEKLTLTRKQMLKEIFTKMLSTINQTMAAGGKPLGLPDMSTIADILEIPMAPTQEVFDLSGWHKDDSDNIDEDDITKQEKVDENNKDKKRRPRTRQEVRKRIA
jgi:hypothetical protein